MQGTMMRYPLTLTPLLERAGKLFANVEIVSRRNKRVRAVKPDEALDAVRELRGELAGPE